MKNIAALGLALCCFSSFSSAQDIYSAPSTVGVSAPGQVPATATNDNACASCVGAVLTASQLTPVSISVSGTPVDIVFQDFPAGNWFIYGGIQFSVGAGTLATNIGGWVNTTSATSPPLPNFGAGFQLSLPFSASQNQTIPVFGTTFSFSTTTRVYLSCVSTFTVSTNSCRGSISGYRIR